VLDPAERDIVAFITGHQKRAYDVREQQLQVFDERIRNLAGVSAFGNCGTRARCLC
jgi:hypothetical protein